MGGDSMKIRIEIDEENTEEEVVIKCNSINNQVKIIQSTLSDLLSQKTQINFFKKGQEYYIDLEDILFFESNSQGICAHTANDMYYVKHKLYELEKVLPSMFIRISKSSIVNIKHIYSILKNLTSASRIEFYNTNKIIYVSRYYYQQLKSRLTEMRR